MPNSAANASTQGSNAQVTFDPAVTAALGMGWHMSELYQEVAVLDRSLEPDPPDLPGLSALGSRQLIHLRFDQILSGLSRLSDKVSVGGLSVEDLKSQVTTAAVQFGPLESAPSAAGQTPSISTQHIRQVVLKLHIGVLDTLTSVDACIGKAYGLGRALGDLTMRPAESSQNSFSTDFGGRVDELKGWLHDLKTVLPDHAAVSVRLSLDIWKQWIADTSPTDSVWSEPAAWHDPLHPNSTLSVVTDTLCTQGVRWRSVLTGEKKATDAIGNDDFVAATEALVQRVGAIVRRFLIQFWVPFTVGLVLLVGIVVALIFVQGGSGGGLGALGAIAAAGGITWKGVESSLGTAIKNTEPALWGAELDLVIAVGITRLPGEAQASLSVPRDKTKSPSVGLKQ